MSGLTEASERLLDNWVSPETAEHEALWRRRLAAIEAEARAPLQAALEAAMAREQAEEALAEHMDRDAYNLTIPDWKASERERDRLTADRALAVAALRAALQPLTGGMR